MLSLKYTRFFHFSSNKDGLEVLEQFFISEEPLPPIEEDEGEGEKEGGEEEEEEPVLDADPHPEDRVGHSPGGIEGIQEGIETETLESLVEHVEWDPQDQHHHTRRVGALEQQR